MKYVFILIVALTLAAPGRAEFYPAWKTVRVPDRALHALDSLYPFSKEVQWTKRKSRFTADFIYNGTTVSVTFDRSGEVVSSTKEISFEILPDRVKEKFFQYYPSYKVVMVLEITSHDKIEYEVQVIKGRQHFILNYHPRGYLLHHYEVEKTDWSEDFN